MQWLAIYLLGYIIAFLVSFVSLLIAICADFGTYGHNLRQVGARVSWIYGLPKEIDKDDLAGFGSYLKKFALSLVFCAVNALQSWLLIVQALIGSVRGFLKSFGVPKDVRNARWRIKNLRMDFDGVLRNLKAIEGKTDYARDRAELLASLRDRKLISDSQFDRLMIDQPENGRAA